MRSAHLAAMVLVGALIIGCGGGGPAATPQGYVSRAMLGAAWPLTVESGTLSCRGAGEVYFRDDASGNHYTVNGTARTAQPALPEIDEIWANDTSNNLGLKKNLGPLIDRGLALC